jgi:hypothetical protein
VVLCGHCKQRHASVAEVRECFKKAQVHAEQATAANESNPKACGKCHDFHGNALVELWKCLDQIAIIEKRNEHSRKSQSDAQPNHEPSKSKWGISCGHPLHRHSTIPEARDCYVARSNRKQRSQDHSSNKTCIHDVKAKKCVHCKEPPKGINEIVYITKGGSAYHNKPNCKSLLNGQSYAQSLGKNTHPVKTAHWSQVTVERQPCQDCCHILKYK